MKDQWRILHLTDFHVSNPDGDQEHLRAGFYEEYIEGLAKVVKATCNDRLDAIVLTGDLIDRGSLANFDHVDCIIDHLGRSLSVGPTAIFVCNGNHDLDRGKDTTAPNEARERFSKTASRLGNGAATSRSPRAHLVRTDGGLLFLSIDSTLGAEGEDRPGRLEIKEVDQIISMVKKEKPGSAELLVVASHHPASTVLGVNGPFDEADPGWQAKHIWNDGFPVHDRLQQLAECPILWLSGDIHRDAYVVDGAVHAIVTGRFGSSTKHASQMRRQARVVRINTSGDSDSLLYEYVPQGHVDHPHTGKWTCKVSKPEKHSRPAFDAPPSSVFPESPRLPADSSSHDKAASTTSSSPQLLSGPLQAEILTLIAEERLYSLGRFTTSDDESALAWISIASLMDQEAILGSCMNEMSKWWREQSQENPDARAILIGIDSWGAILASQISIMTGIRNQCVAARAQGLTHSESEQISDSVRQAVKDVEVVVLICDVVGTGRSVNHVYQKLIGDLGDTSKARKRWFVLSVFCDELRERGNNLDFVDGNFTIVKDLRMPILPNALLPDESILPSTISFTHRKPM